MFSFVPSSGLHRIQASQNILQGSGDQGEEALWVGAEGDGLLKVDAVRAQSIGQAL